MKKSMTALAWICAVTVAAAPGDDPESRVWQGEGEKADERYGASVSTAGDFDADQRDEYLIGIPGHSKKGVDAGAVVIVSGRTGKVLHTLYGKKAGDRFGHSVDGLRDVNADGFADIIVGAPGHKDGTGAAYVYLGKKAKERVVLEGTTVGEQFGWSVSAAGDINQDGFFDIIVGSPSYDGAAGDDCGRATVFSGKSKGKKAIELYSWEGETPGAQFGWSVTHTENIYRTDLDTTPITQHVAVGAPGAAAKSGGVAKGLVYMYDGLNGELLRTIEGRRKGQRFGHAIHAAGDANSDSFGDLIVGSDSVPGGADLISGRNGKALHRFEPERPDMRFGWAVGGGGDFDNDSFDDVVVSAPGEFKPGDTTDPDRVPYVRAYSGKTGKLLLEMRGGPLEDRFGISVAVAGDNNVDRYDEIIIGADQIGVRAGFVEVHSLHPE